MRTPLTPIVSGLLLVVLLSYRRRFRTGFHIRNIRLTMWYPERTLTCISYSITRRVTSTWMTYVSLPAEEDRRRQHRQLQPLLRQQLQLQLQRPQLPQQRRRLLLPRRRDLRHRRGLAQLRRTDRRPAIGDK